MKPLDRKRIEICNEEIFRTMLMLLDYETDYLRLKEDILIAGLRWMRHTETFMREHES